MVKMEDHCGVKKYFIKSPMALLFIGNGIRCHVTPAYAGNFIGRMFYFDKEDRKEVIS